MKRMHFGYDKWFHVEMACMPSLHETLISKKITPDQIKLLTESHNEEPFCNNEKDAFWLY